MDTRAYIILDVVDGKAEEAANILRGNAGVKIVDLLEGPPDLIVLLQARNRPKLAKLTNHAFASVETMTDNQQLLPVQNGSNTVDQT